MINSVCVSQIPFKQIQCFGLTKVIQNCEIHLISRMVQTRHTAERAMEREKWGKAETLSRSVSPFLAWGNFHARSRFARSTIPEEKWGTTRSLSFATMLGFSCNMFKCRDLICFEFSPNNVSFVVILYQINAHSIMICVVQCYVRFEHPTSVI